MDHLCWPELKLDDWADTKDTLHLWLQIVGKIEMVSTSLVNHWWNVTFEVSPRGLRTRLMRAAGAPFDAEFDFVDHALVLRTHHGHRRVELAPKTVAQFWAEVQTACDALGVDRSIWASPNEVAPAIPFAEDTEHASYDRAAVERFFGQLVSAEHVFSEWRAGFVGKDSPVQLFWGSMDLSCTRFSGRNAPPRTGANPPACPSWVMAEAESRENAAAGFWPGGSSEGSFYAYTYPEPSGYRNASIATGSFDTDLGEWVLPYEDVRTSRDPDATLLAFLNETYALGADLAGWDRKLLEIDPHRLDRFIYHRNDDPRTRPPA